MLWVTNTTESEIKVVYDTKEYVFPVNKAVEISEEVAGHFFAYGQDDKIPALTRLGWARTANDNPDGLKKIARMLFSDAYPQKKSLPLSPEVQRVAPPQSKTAGRKPLSVVA